MIAIRKKSERGRSKLDWLDSSHTFSFADYYDPRHMGFRSLRVINEDIVAPGAGFGTHPHRDMEILTYVLEGSIEHRDSLGNGSVLRPGEVQRMTAGKGINHSEFNPSKTEPLHFLQIWILPERPGLEPGYDQRPFPLEEKRNQFVLAASRDGRDGSLTVHQDAAIYAGKFLSGAALTHKISPGRHIWIQMARGKINLNGQKLEAGDAIALSDEKSLNLAAASDAELLMFDLA